MIKIPTNGGNAVVWKMDADGEMEFTTAKDVKMGDRIEVRGRFLPIVEITQDNIVVSEAGAIHKTREEILASVNKIVSGLREMGVECEEPEWEGPQVTVSVLTAFKDGLFYFLLNQEDCVEEMFDRPAWLRVGDCVVDIIREPDEIHRPEDCGFAGSSVSSEEEALDAFRQLKAGVPLSRVSISVPVDDEEDGPRQPWQQNADWWKGK